MDFMENANIVAQTRIQNLRKLAELATPICQAACEFDGKVFNKRFTDRVKELTGSLAYVKDTGTSIQITGGMHMYSNDTAMLMSVPRKDLKDGKRISAQLFSDSAIKQKHLILKRADEIEEYMSKVPEIRKHIDEAKDELNKYLDEIPSDIHDIYRIPYVLRTA